MKTYESEETTAVRSRCRYELFDREPTSGRWWAVKVKPVGFPDDKFHPTTVDGAPVEQACVIAAERRADGTWQWCHLSILAKRVFGDLIFDSGVALNVWYYVAELEVESEARPIQCEHGIPDDDYCEPCNKAYKDAAVDPENDTGR